MQTQQLKNWYYYFPNVTSSLMYAFLFPFFLLIYPMPSTVSNQSCWGILIYFFLFYQIGMKQPAYDKPGICNPGTTHINNTSAGNRLPLVVSLANFFQVWYPDSSLEYSAKNDIQLYGAEHSPCGVWCTTIIGTYSIHSWQMYPTGTYTLVQSTI